MTADYMLSPSPKKPWANTVLEVLLVFAFLWALMDAWKFRLVDDTLSIGFILIATIVFIIFLILPNTIEKEPEKPWVCGTPFIEKKPKPRRKTSKNKLKKIKVHLKEFEGT
jgi:ABC-type branched-subunit amino acid transport system permease subunit